MKITTLVAAAALATASTAAVADTANVTTDSGEIVMIEKNAAAALFAMLPMAFVAIAVAASAANSGS